MDIDTFWRMIDDSRSHTDDLGERYEVLTERLTRLPTEEIVAFERIYREQRARAYDWTLWGAAVLIEGGCSDDGFFYFRLWLISQGRDVFERALADPDSLADHDLVGDYPYVEPEDLGGAARTAYERVTGTCIPDEMLVLSDGSYGPSEPSGERLSEDELDERLPRLSAMY